MVSDEYRKSMMALQELIELNLNYRFCSKVMSAYNQ